MRLFLLIQKPQRRGAEVFTYQLSRALQRRGHSTRLACLYSHQGLNPLPVQPPHELLEGRENHPLERRLTFHPRLLAKLSRSIQSFGPDIVQVHGGRTVKYGALATFLQPHRSWKLVYRNIGDPTAWLQTSLHRIFYRWIVAPRLDGILGVSRYTLEAARKVYGTAVPCATIPGAVDPEMLAPERSAAGVRRALDTPLEAPVLISVASLTREKRPDRLLAAMERMTHESSAHLWLVGDGPLRHELEIQATRSGVHDRIHFLGVRADVGDLLHAADVFVLTSDTEGVPGALLEAGYSGLPAVATRVGGVEECVIHGKTGFLIPPEDGDGLVHCLRELLRSTERRHAMGRQAAKYVRRHFMIDSMAERCLAFYQRLLESPA